MFFSTGYGSGFFGPKTGGSGSGSGFSAASKNYFFFFFFSSSFYIRCWHVVCLCVLGKFWLSRTRALKSCSWSTCVWPLGGCKNEANIIDEKLSCFVLMLDNKRKIFAWLLYLLHASNKSKFSMSDVSQSTTTLNTSMPVCGLILVYSWLSIQSGMWAKVDARTIHKQTKWRHEIREVFNLFNLSNVIREVQVFGFCTACIA